MRAPIPRGRTHRPIGWFQLRLPALPLDEWLRLQEGLVTPSALRESQTSDAALRSAIATDLRLTGERLRAAVGTPLVAAGLWLSSRELFSRVLVWLDSGLSAAQAARLERTLLAYLSRIATRPTPFGLAAGYALGEITTRTRLATTDLGTPLVASQVSYEYLAALGAALAERVNDADDAVFFSNSSLYRHGASWRFVERSADGAAHVCNLVQVHATRELDLIITVARDGATRAQLLTALLDCSGEQVNGAVVSEAGAFLDEAIERQLVVSALVPPVVSDDCLDDVITAARRTPILDDALKVLTRVKESLLAIERPDQPQLMEQFAEADAMLDGLIENRRPFRRVLQADLSWPHHTPTLAANVADELLDAAAMLASISPTPPSRGLAAFIERFEERYGDASVPLMDLLDDDSGLAFGDEATHLSAAALGLPFSDETAPRALAAGSREMFLAGLITSTMSDGADHLTLSRPVIEQLAAFAHERRRLLPGALAIVASIHANSVDDLDRGQCELLFKYAHGPSGAQLFGRFTQKDRRLRELVTTLLRAEEELYPDDLFAEVVHLPLNVVGNVVRRSPLRNAEIRFLGRSAAPSDGAIPLEDIVVTVDLGQVFLRLRSTGQRIRPRLASAHYHQARENFSLYRFLGAVQEQDGSQAMQWQWGGLEILPYLPAVVWHRTIVQRARWSVAPQELAECSTSWEATDYAAVARWRRRRRIPPWIVVAEGDREVPVNLENPRGMELFVDIVRRRAETVVHPFDPSPAAAGAGPKGTWLHDVVVPFVGRADQPRPKAAASDLVSSRSAWAEAFAAAPLHDAPSLVFPPGSPWLYTKFYLRQLAGDRFLRDVLRPLVTALTSTGVEKWFFLRYADPQPHIRFRCFCSAAELAADLHQVLHKHIDQAINARLSWRCQFDTYRREATRYGGLYGVELAEALFWADSSCALDLVAQAETESSPGRWPTVLMGVDRLLRDCTGSLEERIVVLDFLRRSLDARLHTHRPLRTALGKRYRDNRETVAAALDGTGFNSDVTTAIELRSRRVRPLILRMRDGIAGGTIATPITHLTASFIHLAVNRLCGTSPDHDELVAYDALLRYYAERQARGNP